MVSWLFKSDDPIGDKQEAEDTAILLGDLKYSTVLVCLYMITKLLKRFYV